MTRVSIDKAMDWLLTGEEATGEMLERESDEIGQEWKLREGEERGRTLVWIRRRRREAERRTKKQKLTRNAKQKCHRRKQNMNYELVLDGECQ